MPSKEDQVQTADTERPAPKPGVDDCETDMSPNQQVLRKKDDLIGITIAGRYTLTAKIGAGGMGVVYKATQGAVERDVAIKVLLPELVNDESLVARFHLEAKAASRLVHPNTITVYDFGQHEDLLFIAMEYLEGVSLSQVLRQGPMPPGRCVKIMLQMLRSLAEAHKKGVIHRDIKPDNIFLVEIGDETDFVKVLDFGVAKLHGTNQQKTLTQVGMIFGTPTYMSPEQARCQPLDSRSDIYALGVLMYEMLLGVCPFTAEEPVGLLLKHVTEPPPTFEEVHPELQVPKPLEVWVMKALEKDRADRFETADEMANQLEAIAHDLQITFRTTALPIMQGATPRTPVPGVPSTEEVMKTQAADFLGIGAPITDQDTLIAHLGEEGVFTDLRRPALAEAGLTPTGSIGWDGDLKLDLSATLPPRSVPQTGLAKNTIIMLGAAVAVLLAFVVILLIALLSDLGDSNEAVDLPPIEVVKEIVPEIPRDPPLAEQPDADHELDELVPELETDVGASDVLEAEVTDNVETPPEEGPLPSNPDDKTMPAAAVEIDVSKKEKTEREVVKRTQEKFSLTITSVPPGATVYEGGRSVGRAPVTLTEKSGSILDVTVKKSGYKTDHKLVPLTKNKSLRVVLEPMEPTIVILPEDKEKKTPLLDSKKPDPSKNGDEIPEDVYGDP